MSAYKYMYNLHSQINLSFKLPPPLPKKKKNQNMLTTHKKYNKLTQ